MRTKRFLGAAAFLASLALVVGACGDDDDDEGSGGGGSAAQAPAGAPVEIGFMNVENSPAGNYPEVRLGAEAAVEHINNDLDGVNGRPLEMETCITNASGESSIACANKFVQGNKVAVSYGYDFGGSGSVPVLATAGIPVVGGLATEPAQLTSPNSFLFVGGISGAVPAVARYVGEDLKPTKVSIVAADFPASHAAVDQFYTPVLRSFGVTDIAAIYEQATAADFTPALTKANEGDPGAIIISFGGDSCSKFMQGSATLGIPTERMIYLQTCTNEAALGAGGAGAEGIRANSPFLPPGSDDPQVKEYEAALEEYSPDASAGPDSQSGFNSIMNLYALMKKISGEITPQSITDVLKATNNEPSFMAHEYTCDGQQVPGLSAICNANERIVKYEGGEPADVKGDWIEGVSRLGG